MYQEDKDKTLGLATSLSLRDTFLPFGDISVLLSMIIAAA
jgi:hypothetical protein